MTEKDLSALPKIEAYLEGELNRLSLVSFALDDIKCLRGIESQKAVIKSELDDLSTSIVAAKADLDKVKDDAKKAKDKAAKTESDAEERAKKIIEEANNHAQQVLAKAVLEGDKRKRELAEENKQEEAKLAGMKALTEEWKLKAEAAKNAHDTYMTALGK